MESPLFVDEIGENEVLSTKYPHFVDENENSVVLSTETQLFVDSIRKFRNKS